MGDREQVYMDQLMYVCMCFSTALRVRPAQLMGGGWRWREFTGINESEKRAVVGPKSVADNNCAVLLGVEGNGRHTSGWEWPTPLHTS